MELVDGKPVDPGVGPVRDVPRRLSWLEHTELGHPTDTNPAAWPPTEPTLPLWDPELGDPGA